MMQSICEKIHNTLFPAGFMLRKWKTSDKKAEKNIPLHLHDQDPAQLITCMEVSTRVPGVEWDPTTDAFRPLVPVKYEPGRLTKR